MFRWTDKFPAIVKIADKYFQSDDDTPEELMYPIMDLVEILSRYNSVSDAVNAIIKMHARTKSSQIYQKDISEDSSHMTHDLEHIFNTPWTIEYINYCRSIRKNLNDYRPLSVKRWSSLSSQEKYRYTFSHFYYEDFTLPVATPGVATPLVAPSITKPKWNAVKAPDGQEPCCVCIENKRDACLNPCGHVLCADCVHKSNTCPTCRIAVSSITRLYM